MRDYVTEVIVLHKEPLQEMDSRVFLYTRDSGKVIAKVTSGRKITSKLSPHLEPLSIATVRIIEKNGVRIADALRAHALPLTHLPYVQLVHAMTFVGHRDNLLWDALRDETTSLVKLLAILGFNPEVSVCEMCNGRDIHYFFFEDAGYFCKRCFPSSFSSGEYLALS